MVDKRILDLAGLVIKFLRKNSHCEIVEENENVTLKNSYPLERCVKIISLFNNVLERKCTFVHDEKLFLDMKTFWEADKHVITLNQYDELEDMLFSVLKSIVGDKAEEYTIKLMRELMNGVFCQFSPKSEVIDGLVWCNDNLDVLFFNTMTLIGGTLEERASSCKTLYKLLEAGEVSAFSIIKHCIRALKNKPTKKVVHFYTYFGRDKSGLVKIGRSVNPYFREKQIRTGNPTFEIFAIVEDDIEHDLHVYYKSKCKFGEWFSLTKDEIESILQQNNVLFRKYE